MAGRYREIFAKSFKKQVDDDLFSFLIVDSVNDRTSHYEEMWSHAKQRGFEVYVADVKADVGVCAGRNVHSRSEEEIRRLKDGWEATPAHFNRLDLATHVKGAGSDGGDEIENVEMELEDAGNEAPAADDKNDDDDDEVVSAVR